MHTTKKRNAFIAALFNLINPGLGFLYVGKPIYAMALPLSMVLLLALGSWTKIIFIPLGMLAVVTVWLVVWFGSIVVAGFIARRQPEGELLKFQRWYVYIGFVVITSIVANVVISNRGQLFGYETFRFPSKSMDETLLFGDFLSRKLGSTIRNHLREGI